MDRHASRLRHQRRTEWPPRPLSTIAPTRRRPFTRAERDSVTVLFGGLHWRLERLLQAVLEQSGHRARVPSGRDQGGLARRSGARGHRAMLPDQLHDRKPDQLPAEGVQGDRGRRGRQALRLPDGRFVRRVPLRPVSPELRARLEERRPRCLPHVPDVPGADGSEGGHGRRPQPEPPDDARLPVGDLLHRPRAGPRIPGAAVRGGSRPTERRRPREHRASLRGVPHASSRRGPWRSVAWYLTTPYFAKSAPGDPPANSRRSRSIACAPSRSSRSPGSSISRRSRVTRTTTSTDGSRRRAPRCTRRRSRSGWTTSSASVSSASRTTRASSAALG